MENGQYDFNRIEQKWQDFWLANKTFKTPDSSPKPKYYVLDMFPYPSGAGLHVGHPEGYTASDIVARYKRMRGFNVLHPMGWDAFGLPAEQYAVQTGTHPAVTTQKNIDNMRRQIQSLGFSYDWDREVNTTDVGYVKWTQWIFLKFFNSWFDESLQKARPISELPIPDGLTGAEREKYVNNHRLAYESEAPVNWCPALGTVLANEEVVGGVSERGGHPVIRKPMRQWMLRITKYAQRLLDGLEGLDWSESIKKLQQDWIGKSVGAEVDFILAAEGSTGFQPVNRGQDGRATERIRVFTTRPDTLFGATYMVMAPEHKFVEKITTAEYKQAVENYKQEAARKSDLDRTDLSKDKSGQFTGAYAINPVNGQKIPIWISDYVLISYGTGAIMAVPAHDERDFEFATKFGLPIIQVVQPEDVAHPSMERKRHDGSATDLSGRSRSPLGQGCFTGDGVAVNSGRFTGLRTPEFKEQITVWLEKEGLGKKAVNYKLRDWLFSRQRYWGEPFPILHTQDGRIIALDESDLPLQLPKLEDYKPSESGEPPLAKATNWVNVTLPDGTKARRETNTMPQWAGSCWYYLRYMDPRNATAAVDFDKQKYWLPIDLYIGGAEHAVLHLLYSRFWHKLLYDLGYVSTPEPYQKLINQGMILGEDNQKMSKSRGNVINPDQVVKQYGADSMRLYEMFMGPLEATKPWSMQGVEGVHRFLQRVWRMIINPETGEVLDCVKDCGGGWHGQASLDRGTLDEATVRILHQTIKKVTEDIDGFAFNTAISQMMIFVNHLSRQDVRPKDVIEKFVLILSPFAPHIAEELWQRLGHADSLAYESWPAFDAALAKEKEIEMAVQVMGKIKDKITVTADATDEQIQQVALAGEKVQAAMAGKPAKKIIVIKPRLVNIVV